MTDTNELRFNNPNPTLPNPDDENTLTPMGGEPSSAFAGEVEAEDITNTADGAPGDVAADNFRAADRGEDRADRGGAGQGTDIDDSILETLRVQLEAANARADAERDAYLRALADYQNFKRRNEEERDSLRTFLTTSLLERFLPLVDNFERALNAAGATQDYEKLIGGVKATHRQMLELLERENVRPIETAGQMFDPNFHNAVVSEETSKHPDGTILEELQRGFTLGSRVLRPTMVKVATNSTGAPQPSDSAATE